jgi:regulator of protease activity HflC (stomatin/prohibitin superfamily)
MRKSLSAFISASLLLFSLPQMSTASAQEICRTFNFSQTFNFGYNPDFPTWTTPGVKRVITWVALDSGELNGKRIQRSLGTPNLEWLKEAFQSWDDALDSVSFQQINAGSNADIKIGWTQVLQLDYETLFQVRTAQPVRTNASIELKTGSVFLIFEENFIQAVQADIGHILGMGYINPSTEFESVMEWPFQAPYGQVPLGEFDVSLIRAIYSESTCPSSFSPVIQSKINQIAAVKAAEEKAAADRAAAIAAEEKAAAVKAEEARAAAAKEAAEKAAAAKAAAAKAKIEASKKIICKKGFQSKTFVASKCPPGWTKAKR